MNRLPTTWRKHVELNWELDYIYLRAFSLQDRSSYIIFETRWCLWLTAQMAHTLHSCFSSGCCLCGSAPDWYTASLTGSPEGSLWCSVLCWSKGGTGSLAAAFCWVCVSRGTGRGLRNGPPKSSGRPRYCWGTRRARSSCRNCCSRPVRGNKKAKRINHWQLNPEIYSKYLHTLKQDCSSLLHYWWICW